MKFGQKLRNARKSKRLTQEELAGLVGVSKRTIVNYESGTIYPKERKMYSTLAGVLGVETSYLVSEDEEFIVGVSEEYGSRGIVQAKRIMSQISAMFAGGELGDDDKLAFIHQIQEIYLDSKQSAKIFAPDKYKK